MLFRSSSQPLTIAVVTSGHSVCTGSLIYFSSPLFTGICRGVLENYREILYIFLNNVMESLCCTLKNKHSLANQLCFNKEKVVFVSECGLKFEGAQNRKRCDPAPPAPVTLLGIARVQAARHRESSLQQAGRSGQEPSPPRPPHLPRQIRPSRQSVSCCG